MSCIVVNAEDLNSSRIPKKYLKGAYQLYVEFIKKVLLRMKYIIVASSAGFFLTELLDKYEAMNIPEL